MIKIKLSVTVEDSQDALTLDTLKKTVAFGYLDTLEWKLSSHKLFWNIFSPCASS